MRKSIDVHERLPFFQMVPLGLRIFRDVWRDSLGTYINGIITAVALFTSGTGTLIFIFIIKEKFPRI